MKIMQQKQKFLECLILQFHNFSLNIDQNTDEFMDHFQL